jgi:hypothetical protein
MTDLAIGVVAFIAGIVATLAADFFYQRLRRRPAWIAERVDVLSVPNAPLRLQWIKGGSAFVYALAPKDAIGLGGDLLRGAASRLG